MAGVPLQEIDQPLPLQRELLERDIQSASINWARAEPRNAYCRKFRSPANRSAPDYVITYRGFTWYVEFKKEGSKPTTLQEEEHAKIRAAGGTVWVVDSKGQFKRLWEQRFG